MPLPTARSAPLRMNSSESAGMDQEDRTSRHGSGLRAAAASAALLLVLPLGARAQVGTAIGMARNLSVQARAGAGFPGGDLANVEDPGFSAGLGISYRLASRMRVRADADLETLLGKAAAGTPTAYPDLELWHYGAGLELELLRPIVVPWRVSAGVEVGATTWKLQQGSSSKTYPTTGGFVRVGYSPAPIADLFVQGRAYLMFTSASDFAALGSPSPIGDRAWSFPLQAGVALHVP